MFLIRLGGVVGGPVLLVSFALGDGKRLGHGSCPVRAVLPLYNEFHRENVFAFAGVGFVIGTVAASVLGFIAQPNRVFSFSRLGRDDPHAVFLGDLADGGNRKAALLARLHCAFVWLHILLQGIYAR